MKVIGITGSNGKTTITHVLEEVLTKAGFKVGVIGTLTGRLTTPSPWELAEIFEDFRQKKMDYVVMEVSSHGIHQDRIKGIFYHVKLLTNITQDHLDYHKTIREYRKVKLGWMKKGDCIKIYPKDYKKEKIDFEHPYQGKFNENNIKSALAILKSLNFTEESKLKKIFKNLSYVPGRFQLINKGQPFKVIVDYAHTPDGLLNVLKTSRDILKKDKRKGAKGKLITVFGAGGDRDVGKRPIMGKVANKYSEVVIVTSDNPRSEDPHKIIKDIIEGVNCCFWHKKRDVIIEPDRRIAIEKAIKLAEAHDIVMIAGKGHETYQIIGENRDHFDDREEVARVLSELGYK
jgi:UDP-N-acetylmuramoyl-L-alanyl-D-glutamate--2,6-diaminopimelate ligase